MEVIHVTCPPPEIDPETLGSASAFIRWKEKEFVERGALCLKQSAKIQSLSTYVQILEEQVSNLCQAAAGLLPAVEQQLLPPTPEPEAPDGEEDHEG